jgi:hypothetical protein
MNTKFCFGNLKRTDLLEGPGTRGRKSPCMALLSIDGIKYDISKFRGRHELSHETFLLLFEVNLRNVL